MSEKTKTPDKAGGRNARDPTEVPITGTEKKCEPHKPKNESTDYPWNPVTGCRPISPGCERCWARRLAERSRGERGHPYEHGFDLQLRPERLYLPLHWADSKKIITCNMSDFFQRNVPTEFKSRVFSTMERASWHTFQVLTKRSSLMRNFTNRRYGRVGTPPHIWLGVSLESSGYTTRILHLQQTRASLRFVCFEPLLGPVGKLDLSGIHWVIVGPETGPGFRPMKLVWAREIRDQCVKAGIPFFLKNLSGFRTKEKSHLLDGKEWREYPKLKRP